MSTAPNAFIVRCFCPACRHELTGLPYADPVTCPECGADTKVRALPLMPPRRRRHPVAVIVALAIALAVMLGLLLPAIVYPGCRTCMAGAGPARLASIHRCLQIYAEDTTGLYPAHAAVLVPANYYRPDSFQDYRADSGNDAVVGGVDLLQYDWSPEAAVELDAAIASCDVSAAYYRIGDFWLTRLPKPTGSGKLIAGWCDLVVDGERWVVFDDNRVRAVDRDGWGRIWRTDAGERARLGLPRVYAPWWPANDR